MSCALNCCLLFQNGCDLPQIHLLSVKMQANLHHGCPPNCQDLITWLPANQAARIMAYLDPGNSAADKKG